MIVIIVVFVIGILLVERMIWEIILEWSFIRMVMESMHDGINDDMKDVKGSVSFIIGLWLIVGMLGILMLKEKIDIYSVSLSIIYLIFDTIIYFIKITYNLLEHSKDN